MFCVRKSFGMCFFFLTVSVWTTHLTTLSAEQAAWGGNGGWWGGGNREWAGDFDGPGYTRVNYGYSHHDHYHHTCAYCYPQHYNPYYYYNSGYTDPYNQYYYDESIPGGALYFNVR